MGRSALGVVLARALRAAGLAVTVRRGRGFAFRSLRGADVIVLAVPDPHLGDLVAAAAQGRGARLDGVSVLHVAGSRDAGVIAPLRAHGASVGVLHPLVSFVREAAPTNFEGCTFVAAGDAVAMRAARALTRALGGRLVGAPVHGAAYHAAAALAANGAVALAHDAVSILTGLGLTRKDAERAIGGLLGSVANNVATVGVPAALTGPVARGDRATVARHRDALRGGAAGATYDAILPAIEATAKARVITPPRRPRRRRPDGARSPSRTR